MLGSEEEFAGEGEIRWPPAEGFFGREANEIGIVVFLGDVSEYEMADAGIETFRIDKEFTYRMIGEMAGAGKHALFDDPGIGANLEHVEIVIGFEDQAIGLTKMDAHVIGEVAEIGADGDLGAIGTECESDRVRGIVRYCKGVNINVADGETLAGLDGFDAAKASAEGIRKDALECVHGGFGHVERSLPKTENLGKAIAVVGMFMGDEYRIEAIDFATDGREAGEGFAFAETSVDEDAGGWGFEQGEIARTAGGEDGDAKADGDAPGLGTKKYKTLKIMAERWWCVNAEGIGVVEKRAMYGRGRPLQGKSDGAGRSTHLTNRPVGHGRV